MCGHINVSHYLRNLTCFLSWIKKLSILNCFLVHQNETEWEDIYQKCNGYTSLHRIKFAWCPVPCVLHGWYLIVSAENLLGVTWLEILTGGSLQSSDNLHVPLQESLYKILLQREREQKASDFPEVKGF